MSSLWQEEWGNVPILTTKDQEYQRKLQRYVKLADTLVLHRERQLNSISSLLPRYMSMLKATKPNNHLVVKKINPCVCAATFLSHNNIPAIVTDRYCSTYQKHSFYPLYSTHFFSIA